MMDDSTPSQPGPDQPGPDQPRPDQFGPDQHRPPGQGPNAGNFGPSDPNNAEPAPESPVTFQDARAFFIGGAVLGTLLVGVITIYQWLDPWKPALIAVAMGALLSATIAFVYVNRDQTGAFARGFTIWTALALPTVAWGFAPVRALALDLMGGQLSEQAQLNVLDDPGEDVLQSACTALSEDGSVVVKSLLAERLAASPALGKACVEALAGANAAQAASMSASFLRQWKSALAAKDAPKVCQTAPHLFEMSATQPARPALPLTRCAVGEIETDADEAMANCCADALVAHYDSASGYVDALGPTAEIDERLLPSLFATMTPYAFRNINASRLQLPSLQSKLLRQKPTQDWLTELACNGMIISYTPSEFFGGMEAIAQTQGCNLSIGDDRGTSQWQQICEQWAASPDEGLCPPIEHQAKGQAVTAAVTQVHNAIHAFYTSDLGRQIVKGAAFLSRSDGTVEGFGEQLADAYGNTNMPAGLGNAQYRHAARQFAGGSQAYMQVLREHAPELTNSDPSNANKAAQDLLENGIKPKASYDELKSFMTPEQRERMQPRIDKLRKQIDSTDAPVDSSLTDFVR